MNEEVIIQGKIFELVQLPQPDGRVFEIARRAPGVRILIADKDNKTMLLTREFRHELGEWDYRLPGGKVFDTLEQYETFRLSEQDIIEPAKQQAIREAQQEAGIEIDELELFKKSTLGATVEWDLYVFEATRWQANVYGQELEVGEMIEADTWVSYDEAQRMILAGDMHEERVALIVLQWLEGQKQ